MNNEKKELIDKMNSIIDRPGGQLAARFILNSLGAIPIVGGVISAGGSLWGDIEQQNFNELLALWATKTDIELKTILDSLNNILQTPTKAKLALLIGEIMGKDNANIFLSAAGNQIPMVLNNETINELHPFSQQGWISLASTHSTASMGAGNRVGNHIEEIKRPWGMGSGFVLTINQLYFS